MNLVESYTTKNPRYKTTATIAPSGIMLHSVGCNQPDAQVFLNQWNSADVTVGVHAIVDGNTGTVYQALPWTKHGWHCGKGDKGTANASHIGVEMCEPSTISYTSGANFTCSNLTDARAVATRTYKAAVELFAFLCKKYNLDPTKSGVIISHSEGHTLGLASNHGDPVHLWKGLGLNYTMDGFRKDVKNAMSTATTSTSTTTTKADTYSSYAKEACEWAKANKYVTGDNNGKYGWQDSLTLERALVIMKRVMGK